MRREIRMLLLTAALVAGGVSVPVPQSGATTVSATTLVGGVNTFNSAGVIYAKSGGVLTLTVVTDSQARCVELSPAVAALQTSTGTKTSWVFSWTDGALSNGTRPITATAGDGGNSTKCKDNLASRTVSYIVDNSAPTVTAVKTPNTAWSKTNVGVVWSASDSGSGIASGPSPSGATVSAEGPTNLSSQATDNLGFTGTGTTSVLIDKTLPTITGAVNPTPNAAGWNKANVTVSFNCTDPANSSNATAASGIASCAGGNSLNQNGITATITGTATDIAGNPATISVGPIKIDKLAPSAPTVAVSPAANADGWNNSNVSVNFSPNGDNPATDASGVASCSAAVTLTGETSVSGETRSGTCTDVADNTSGLAASRLIRIDRAAPNTTPTAPAGWNNSNVRITLAAADNLSGVKATYFILNGAAPALYSNPGISISTEGIHQLEVWSVDVAGNEEAKKSIEIKIDKTNPTINHALSPLPNAGGWNNSDVTVTFTCADPGAVPSGIASCTAPVTVTTNGKNQNVPGTATDNAGNTARDSASVDVDKVKPTITGAADRLPNANGWYKADVVVSFTCNDQPALSGVATCTSPRTLAEGTPQSVTGNVTDKADNADSTSVGPISIDKTAPVVTSSLSGQEGTNGWYLGDVTATWDCVETLSGLDGSCPTPTVLTGEGAGLSAGVSVSDRAGNQGSAAVTGINIDRHAPISSITPPAPVSGDWYAGGVSLPVTVDEQLSGLAHTYATIDGGIPFEVTGGAFPVNGNGVHNITYWSVDNAGNIEAPRSLSIKIDTAPPSIGGSRTPDTNAFGWNNGAVDVSFSCGDSESGVAACAPPQTLGNEGEDQEATGIATDNVGNSASATVSGINIDLTKPTLAGAATTAPNAAGWYRNDAVVHWMPFDSLSGIDPATAPLDSMITGEGSNLGAGPKTVADKAGNVSDPASVSGIKIDRTAPGITAATVPASANADGWFNTAVTVQFTCTDILSGPGSCADDEVLSTDGAGQSASGTGYDVAGNSASVTKSGINIDSQAPSTIGTITCTGKNGWCRNTATITLDATDQAGLSGVKDIYYRFGSSGNFTRKTDPVTFNVPLNRNGLQAVEYYAVDRAGNSETAQAASIKYDTIAPMISITKDPNANAAGWNKADLNVSIAATDSLDGLTSGAGSGPELLTVDATLVDSNTTVGDHQRRLTHSKPFASETPVGGTQVSVEAEDFAGNVSTDSATVKLDKTAPTIAGAATTLPNANGWYKGPVTVRWTCGDALSGVAVCPGDDVLSSNGAGQSKSGTVEDRADNTASATVSEINIDATPPTVVITGLVGSPFVLGSANIGCTATDTGGSGLDGTCSVAITGGNGPVGTFTVSATARDRAGNDGNATGSYRVIYGFSGFLQPVNDTGRPTVSCGSPCVASVFKGGSTIPVKFRLFNSAGATVQSAALPQWVNPKQGSLTTLGVDEVVYTDPSTSGTTYRWDSTAQQHIYNWGTKGVKVSYFWKIGVILDDGNSYLVDVALR